MKNLNQWINWTLQPRPGEPKPAKVPTVPVNAPERFAAYDTVRAIDPAHIGFVLTANDQYFAIDLDHAYTAAGWSTLATSVLAMFPGAYVEISYSGDGLHIIGRGTLPDGYSTRGPGVECYTRDRFIAITGTHAQGDPDTDCSAALATFAALYLRPIGAPIDAGEWTTCDNPQIPDDNDLIRKMLTARVSSGVAFGGKASATDLWTGRVEALADAWPSQTDAYDRSAADAALAAHLAFWTGKDCPRIERLMRLSALIRPKWDRKGDDYLKRTIIGAAARCSRVYQSPEARRAAQIAENMRIGNETVEPPVPAVLTLDDMRARLVFIGSSGAVVDSATHRVRKKDAAADEYAASVHRYTDPDNPGKTKSIPALKAWIASRDRITADVLAWVPGAPMICRPPEIIDGGTRGFNTWRGIPSVTAPDDWQDRAAPFVEHLEYLVPDVSERRRFIQWVAHIIRVPEALPHTAYLMIAETTGIGRNALASILVRVLRGYVAAGVDIAAVLDGRFNGRLSQKLLAVVDEVREGLGERRYQRGERLKSLITEEHRQIDIKYGLQSVEKNCCRWLMFSNHVDALPFENTDRRIIVIANPTVRQSPGYYTRLYGLIDDPAFIPSVRAYLDAVDLSDFRPGEHAPMNDAKCQALDAMMTDTDRAAIDFRETYGAVELTTTASITAFVQMQHGIKVEGRHLANAIKRAGMVSTGRQVKIGQNKTRVVIVRGKRWTPEMIKTASHDALVKLLTGTAGTAGTAVPNNEAN